MCVYVCMYVYVCVCVYKYNKNSSVYDTVNYGSYNNSKAERHFTIQHL
jgi:hypothetical protein